MNGSMHTIFRHHLQTRQKLWNESVFPTSLCTQGALQASSCSPIFWLPSSLRTGERPVHHRGSHFAEDSFSGPHFSGLLLSSAQGGKLSDSRCKRLRIPSSCCDAGGAARLASAPMRRNPLLHRRGKTPSAFQPPRSHPAAPGLLHNRC